jgi:hypothetical protein
MLEAVVLGVVGVLQPREVLWRARVAAVAARLESHGISPVAFERAAWAALRSDGERSPREPGLPAAGGRRARPGPDVDAGGTEGRDPNGRLDGTQAAG